MAINQITSNDILNANVMGTKTSEKSKKAEKASMLDNSIKDEKVVKDNVDFKAETMSLNKEAAESKIKSRDEAEQMMMSVKKLITEKPENTISVHANIAPDAALQLLMQ